MDNTILDELVQIKKPLLILAGPGMGKTTALAYKIKHLIKTERVCRNHITVISFTNEAATNMRKKINSKRDEKCYIEQELQPDVICTMHKLSHRIIKDNCQKIGLNREIKVLSSDNLQVVLMSDCAQIIGARRKDSQQTIICRQKGKCEKDNSLKCKICDEYVKLLRKFNYIDHNDQLFLACKLLREYKDILRAEQQKATYLLVDEYQDINYSQWELINLLSSKNPDNLFVVGDDYQSIYGFRGGDPKYIKNFASDYAPNGIVRNLKTNYRCPPYIFKGAFQMVRKYNGGYNDLLEQITFTEQSRVPIKLCTFELQNQEADFIARTINEIGPSYEILILIPSADYATPIKRALRKRYVNFSCAIDIEDTDFYLIYLLLKWLEVTSDNFNFRILIEELINKGTSDIPTSQTEYIGTNKTKDIRESALRQISNFWNEIGEGKTLYTKLKTLKGDIFIKLISVLTDLRRCYLNKDTSEFISMMLEKLHLWKEQTRFKNEIIKIIDEIKYLSMSSIGSNVRILTMQKAKGLEADYVFIVGIENNVFPRKNANPEEKKENSRLLYVSMTRAKKVLYMLHSKVRNGNITKVKTSGISEFVDAIPKNYIELYEN